MRQVTMVVTILPGNYLKFMTRFKFHTATDGTRKKICTDVLINSDATRIFCHNCRSVYESYPWTKNFTSANTEYFILVEGKVRLPIEDGSFLTAF